MKNIAIIILILCIAGCATKKEMVAQHAPILPSLEFPLESGKTLKVIYSGMPKEIATQFLQSVYNQRNRFIEYWNAAEKSESSVSIWQGCNEKTCTYGFSVFVPCDGNKDVSFAAEGIYPNMRFSYMSHDQGFFECCFPGMKIKQPWWKRIFN